MEALRERGHDVLTVVEDGKGNRRYPDDLILRDATEFGRAVVTLNRAQAQIAGRLLQVYRRAG